LLSHLGFSKVSSLIHPLFQTLKDLKGNSKPIVWTEPLWGIPYNLYITYMPVYMLALGLTDSQIGLVASIGLAFQIFTSWVAGAITDKVGRRLTTFICDIISWSVPCVIWAYSQNFKWFVAAAITNSIWRVSMNAWPLLLGEDSDPHQLIDIYSWIYIFSVCVSFFTPITGLLIKHFSLIPAVRYVLIFSAITMTVKCTILFLFTEETTHGKLRKEQTKDQSIYSLLSGYGIVFKQMFQRKETIFTLAVVVISTICNMISGNFWSIMVTKRLGLSPEWMAAYPFARAIFVLFFFFAIMPRLRYLHFRVPMLAGYIGFVISQLMLIVILPNQFGWLLLSVFIEACSYACLSPQLDRLMIVAIDPHDRARILSIISLVALLISTPFGWLAGTLSEINRVLPFLLNVIFYGVGAILTLIIARKLPGQSADLAEG
jgi:MFS family permease